MQELLNPISPGRFETVNAWGVESTPLFISVVAWDMAAKFGTKVVDYVNNEFVKQWFN